MASSQNQPMDTKTRWWQTPGWRCWGEVFAISDITKGGLHYTSLIFSEKWRKQNEALHCSGLLTDRHRHTACWKLKYLKKNLTTKIQHKNIYLVEKQIFDDEMVPVGPKLPASSSFVGKSMILSGECQNVSVPSINNSFSHMKLLWNWDFVRRKFSIYFGCGLISFSSSLL